MSNTQHLKAADPVLRLNALETVVRAMLSSMTPEQINKARVIATRGAQLAALDPLLTPANREDVEHIQGMVDYLFAHIPDQI
ncbi:hypothetical protein [Escherichia coli]|uniref:hypothetical protein n=1 Tax=Escherichia coli TaxID=562 RepID=UPI000BE5F8F4|nr:hypothetical protein [Escherichia coli]